MEHPDNPLEALDDAIAALLPVQPGKTQFPTRRRMIRHEQDSQRDLSVALSAWNWIVMLPLPQHLQLRGYCLSVSACYRPSQTVPSGHATGTPALTTGRGDHLIRRLCHTHPLPAHSSAGLPECYSLMRSR